MIGGLPERTGIQLKSRTGHTRGQMPSSKLKYGASTAMLFDPTQVFNAKNR